MAETQELYFDFLHKGDRRHRLMELAAKESAQSLRKEEALERAFKRSSSLQDHVEAAIDPRMQQLAQSDSAVTPPSIESHTAQSHPGGIVVIHKEISGSKTAQSATRSDKASARHADLSKALDELNAKQKQLEDEEAKLHVLKSTYALAENQFKNMRSRVMAEHVKVLESRRKLKSLRRRAALERRSISRLHLREEALDHQQLILQSQNALLQQERDGESQRLSRQQDRLKDLQKTVHEYSTKVAMVSTTKDSKKPSPQLAGTSAGTAGTAGGVILNSDEEPPP